MKFPPQHLCHVRKNKMEKQIWKKKHENRKKNDKKMNRDKTYKT